jgi:hypothetical protein
MDIDGVADAQLFQIGLFQHVHDIDQQLNRIVEDSERVREENRIGHCGKRNFSDDQVEDIS